MKRSYVILMVIILVPSILMLLNKQGLSAKIEDNMAFSETLSTYGLFKGELFDLTPCNEAISIEIASSLFTDYAEKQRIILLPKDKKMKANGDGLPEFPDGTIIAKTFFYPKMIGENPNGKHILETRLLIKNKEKWNAATYKWDKNQQEAYLLTDGSTEPVAFTDKNGNRRTIAYKIPSRADCSSCHRQRNKILPIGPKLRNLNIDVVRDNQTINQLVYLKRKEKLHIGSTDEIDRISSYSEESEPIHNRARAYLDINCAHCHSPEGTAGITLLDLRYETPIQETGIWLKQGKISARMQVTGELHMPQKGTTMIHKEGVHLILDYIDNLNQMHGR
ncbi:hypothetical protein PQ465_11675 [Sphingobacterium oryzagri]|uniref:Repeat protein (TIGR03806 family) n=1 Tax=Sphingobacterium oryzagri TaxID=3025669 RepID=A0ABY7WBB8_9SPHI|nr:hypothetical protein [Sphingobacterium sp. KACC 22765]WDF66966.1 hypothetical protein PQ465_11675 [Sphingobacterium sp. KACC 22765]